MKGGPSITATKTRIEQTALSLFAKQGYHGTSLREIAKVVGITKSTFYAHYNSKDDLFMAVFTEVARCHRDLFIGLLENAGQMNIEDKLHHHFVGYILYFYRHPDLRSFSNISLFHVPPELREKIRSAYLTVETEYRKQLEKIFSVGMEEGLIRRGNPAMKVWSFKAARDGVTAWLSASPDLSEESLEAFWNDYWLGAAQKRRISNDD